LVEQAVQVSQHGRGEAVDCCARGVLTPRQPYFDRYRAS
jgi:hypothetical protein